MSEVTGLRMEKIVASIRWRGMVELHHTGEKEESLLGEVQWPKKKGPVYYACATTGLLFDKQSGKCVQTQRVDLLIDTLAPAKPGDMRAFTAAKKTEGYGYNRMPQPYGDGDDE